MSPRATGSTIRGSAITPGIEVKNAGRWYVVEAIDEPTGVIPWARRARVTDTRGRAGELVITSDTDYPVRPARRPAPGRPPTGNPLTLRLPAELRKRLADAGREGEPLAETVRRLLAVALSPVLADALTLAAADWDGPVPDELGGPTRADELRAWADEARAILAQLALIRPGSGESR